MKLYPLLTAAAFSLHFCLAAREVNYGTLPEDSSRYMVQNVIERSKKRNSEVVEYWKNYQFDDKLIKSKQYHERIDTYLDEVVPQHWMHISKGIDKFMSRINLDSELYKHTLTYIADKYDRNKEGYRYECSDNVWSHIVRSYYRGRKAPWLSKEEINTYVKGLQPDKKCQCGKSADFLTLKEVNGPKDWLPITILKNDFTVVLVLEQKDYLSKDMLKLAKEINAQKEQGHNIMVYTYITEDDVKLPKLPKEMDHWRHFNLPASLRNSAMMEDLTNEETLDALKRFNAQNGSSDHHKILVLNRTKTILGTSENESDYAQTLKSCIANEFEERDYREAGEVATQVDSEPTYSYGESAIKGFIRKHHVYPPVAESKNVEGTVLLKMLVYDNGTVGLAEVVKGVSKELDREAIRIVYNFNEWTPAMKGGKPVTREINFPIKFEIDRRIKNY